MLRTAWLWPLVWGVLVVGQLAATEVRAEPAEPWRLGPAVGVPAALQLGLEQRTRFEHLADDFRATATGDATAVSMLTLVSAELAVSSLVAGIELQDARVYATDATPLNTTHVDPLDLLRAYVGIRSADVLRSGDRLDARLGRVTIDLGMRRLVARNRFRNTINSFTGVDATWTSPGKHAARGFVVVPVIRRPADAEGLRRNELELDTENRDALLWGGFYGSPTLAGGTQLELFVVGFHERDGELASRDRQLVTAGLRWFRSPGPGKIDFELEAMPQLGTSRATPAADDVDDLAHRAISTHAELGISPAIAGRPRLVLQHDYASGDRDPADGRMGRFDLLFGARRFDFGPTGIYGPFARGNIQSPGLRISVAPSARFDAFASYRLFWLASRRDAWTTAGLQDPTGGSGSFLGEHAEIQVRWSPRPRNLSLEAGAAYLRRGQFARSAPDARPDPAAYVYTQLVVTIQVDLGRARSTARRFCGETRAGDLRRPRPALPRRPRPDAGAGRAALDRGSARPADARREPDQVAPRAHHVVLRDLRARHARRRSIRAFGFLFNSYYEAVGPRVERARRGLLTRPPLDEVHAYRREIDRRIEDALAAGALDEVAARAPRRSGCTTSSSTRS